MSRHAGRALEELDLTQQDYVLLAVLEETPKGATELAQYLGLSRPRVTSLVDKAVSRGLVVRTAGTTDKREVSHGLTHGGKILLDQADEAIEQTFGEIMCALPSKKLTVVRSALKVWSDLVDAWRVHRQEEWEQRFPDRRTSRDR